MFSLANTAGIFCIGIQYALVWTETGFIKPKLEVGWIHSNQPTWNTSHSNQTGLLLIIKDSASICSPVLHNAVAGGASNI